MQRAYLPRAKALDFKNRNPIDPDLLRMKPENLRRMKHAYSTYKTRFKNREEEELAHLQKEVTDCQKIVTQLDQAKAAASDTDPDAKKRKRTEYTSKEKTADEHLKKTTKELYELEKKVSVARKKLTEDDTADKTSSKKELATVVDELEKGKDKWIEERKVLQAAQSRKAMAEMEMAGRENMSNSVNNHISQLARQIEAIEAQLGASYIPTRGLPSAIIDIDANRNIIHADESGMRAQQSKIAFTIEAKSESPSTRERATTAGIDLNVGGWFASVHADSSVSSASKKAQKDLSECTVDGSFSAILVTIRRPLLHADLFQDFDIDTPDDVKLSPGAAKIKTWIERGDDDSVTDKLADYGKFPAYPTSFIVTADTVLEFKSTESKSEELMSHLSTDSSIKANYGPWGLGGGASLKTDSKDSSMKMEVRGGALRISFQTPQVIGWVSEILPQLPQQKGRIGGLSGPPNKLFRL
ncbi:hypothetical protein NW754_004803 [Fusarium falciforme]|nr:hypothetical protein NW754_004803 [Fusarium falciforme]